MIAADSLVVWMREAAAKGLTVEMRSTGRWDQDRLILHVTSVNGECAEISIDQFAKAKGLFLRGRLLEAA
jgi:hypothetical protein